MGGARTVKQDAEAALGEMRCNVFPDDGRYGEAVDKDDLDATHVTLCGSARSWPTHPLALLRPNEPISDLHEG